MIDDHRRGGPSHPRPRRIGTSRDRLIRQAHDLLRASIRRGLLAPNNTLVEFQLVRSMGIGRNALREALQRLADEGLVVRRPGLGTLVAREMLRVSADEVLAFDGPVADSGVRVSVTELAVEPVRLDQLLVETLGLVQGHMTMIELLICVDGEPICLLDTYVPASTDMSRFTHGYASVSVSFERLLGVPLGRSSTTVEAVNADAHTAATLGVKPGTALILREQVLIAADGSAAVLNIARYRADRVAFIASLTPGPHTEER